MEHLVSRLRQIIETETSGNVSNFAKLLDVPYSTIQGYLNGRMPHSEYLLRVRDRLGISIDWLLTGEGQKHISQQTHTQATLDPDPEISTMLSLAKKVLTSGNPIAYDALERNIKYFAHAVDAEIELQQLKDDVKIIKEEFKILKRENLRFANKASEVPSSEKKVA